MKEFKIYLVSMLLAVVSMSGSAQSGTTNGQEWVDLGLSVKWATCNVGADSPIECGDYFAWGETSTKSVYKDDTCETYKQNVRDYSGNSRYDVASAKWSYPWRTPTKAEWDELKTKCTWTRTTLDGVKGYQVTGPNGMSIFLPLAGRAYNTMIQNVGNNGYYWASTPRETSNGHQSHCCFLNYGSVQVHHEYRGPGFTVRPVR